jgi:hypothetical protein
MCCSFFRKKKTPYLVILSDCFYINFYVKGLVYNFHHLISLKQLEDFKIMLLFNLILLNMVNQILVILRQLEKWENYKKIHVSYQKAMVVL